MTAPHRTAVDLERLARAAAAALPSLDGAQRRVGLAVYRVMATGAPVTPTALAPVAGLPEATVAGVLPGLPTATVTAGAVTAFLGLDVAPGRHRLAFGAVVLGTWCAWDTLFLPALVGLVGTATSTCPVTGVPVTVVVDPADGVVDASPADVQLSFLARPQPFGGPVVAGFCRWIHFLAGPAAAAAWRAGDGPPADGGGVSAGRPEVTVLSVSDGVALGRLVTAMVFGCRG